MADEIIVNEETGEIIEETPSPSTTPPPGERKPAFEPNTRPPAFDPGTETPTEEPTEEPTDQGNEETTPPPPPPPPAPEKLDLKELGKAVTDALQPVIDGMKTQQTTADFERRELEIGQKAANAQKAKVEAMKKKDMAAYDKAVVDLAEAKRDAEALQEERKGKPDEKPTETPTQETKPTTATQDPAKDVPAAAASINAWANANKSWFDAENENSRFYNLSQAVLDESQRLYYTDPDPEVRDLNNSKHWDKIDEFVRSKTGQAKTTTGAGGAEYTNPPVNTGQGGNTPPVSGNTSKAKQVKVDPNRLLRKLRGYGYNSIKSAPPELVKEATRVIRENTKKK